MEHTMMTTFQLILLILALHGTITTCRPLTPEDVEGLLPPTPRDKNETIAAVVQDPVVQDAVQQAASNGSLNGLVVKKNVYIMPASNPNKVCFHSSAVSSAASCQRKNITETKQTEAMESSSVASETFIADVYTPEEIGSGQQQNQMDSHGYPEEDPEKEKRKSETEFLKDTISHDVPLPEDQSKKVAVPIVAVIDPSKAEKGEVKSPIVAILPNQLNNNDYSS